MGKWNIRFWGWSRVDRGETEIAPHLSARRPEKCAIGSLPAQNSGTKSMIPTLKIVDIAGYLPIRVSFAIVVLKKPAAGPPKKGKKSKGSVRTVRPVHFMRIPWSVRSPGS